MKHFAHPSHIGPFIDARWKHRYRSRDSEVRRQP
jgi:hypothetical protein